MKKERRAAEQRRKKKTADTWSGVAVKKREGEEEEEEEEEKAAYLESFAQVPIWALSCPENALNLDRMESRSRCDPTDPVDPSTIPSRSCSGVDPMYDPDRIVYNKS
ncbi:hypothetical protein CsSME_00008518 [Camellia sinensis var. sinensis]